MTTQARELAKLVTNAGDVNLGDDISLASDGAILNFGADSDVTLTHVADTGLLLNSSRQLQFGDSGTFIRQEADGVLDLTSDTEIELNATTLDINANVDISGTLTVAGALDFGDLDISNVGSLALDTITNDGTDITLDSSGDIILDADGAIKNASGNLTLDVVGNIVLDADGDHTVFSYGGSGEVGRVSNESQNLVLYSLVSDKDMKFNGNDGGSTITALTLDMSDAGSATFNNDLTVSGNLVVTGTTTQTGSLVSNTNFQGLSQSNSGNSTDFGFFGKYVESSTTKYAGLFFDASTDNTFRLYTDSQTAPSTTVNTSATGYAAANIVLAQVDNTQTNVSQSARVAQVALTSSSNAVAWDAKAAQNAYHVTTENTTFSAPSNAVEGAVIQVELAQGGTARTIAWNTVFEFAASTAPTVTATANKTDIFTFRYNGSVWQEIGRVQNMAQT